MNVFKLKNRKGASLAEYGLLVGLIATVAILAVYALGLKIDGVFTSTNNTLDMIPTSAAPASGSSSVPALADVQSYDQNATCVSDANCSVFFTDTPADHFLGQAGVPNTVTLAVNTPTPFNPPNPTHNFIAGSADSMLISKQTDNSFAGYFGGAGTDTLVVTTIPSTAASASYNSGPDQAVIFDPGTQTFNVAIDSAIEYVYFTQDDMRYTFQDMVDASNTYGGNIGSLPSGTGQHMQTSSTTNGDTCDPAGPTPAHTECVMSYDGYYHLSPIPY